MMFTEKATGVWYRAVVVDVGELLVIVVVEVADDPALIASPISAHWLDPPEVVVNGMARPDWVAVTIWYSSSEFMQVFEPSAFSGRISVNPVPTVSV